MIPLGSSPNTVSIPLPDSVTIIRRDAKAAPIQLAFGKEREVGKDKQIACKRDDRVYWVEAKAVSHLTGTPQDWRAKKLVVFDTWAVDRLELEAGASKAALERKDGIWKAGAAEVDAEAVSTRLSALADLQVEAFDRPKLTGAALGKVKLTVEAGATIEASFYLARTPRKRSRSSLGGPARLRSMRPRSRTSSPTRQASPSPSRPRRRLRRRRRCRRRASRPQLPRQERRSRTAAGPPGRPPRDGSPGLPG